MISKNDSLTNTIAVNDMLQEDFKERMKDKYLYDSDDDESDYDSDEESRETSWGWAVPSSAQLKLGSRYKLAWTDNSASCDWS